MKKKIISMIMLWLITLFSIIMNMNNTIAGRGSDENTLITLLYVVYWSAFVILNKNHKYHICTAIWSGATLITAIIGLIVSTLRLDGGILILFAIIFLSPFNGLLSLAGNNWTIIYLIIMIISFIWLLFSVCKYIKGKMIAWCHYE